MNAENTAPKLLPTKKGWMAKGNGWAVVGLTQDEAIRNYRDAEKWRRELLSQPLRSEGHSDSDGNAQR